MRKPLDSVFMRDMCRKTNEDFEAALKRNVSLLDDSDPDQCATQIVAILGSSTIKLLSEFIDMTAAIYLRKDTDEMSETVYSELVLNTIAELSRIMITKHTDFVLKKTLKKEKAN